MPEPGPEEGRRQVESPHSWPTASPPRAGRSGEFGLLGRSRPSRRWRRGRGAAARARRWRFVARLPGERLRSAGPWRLRPDIGIGLSPLRLLAGNPQYLGQCGYAGTRLGPTGGTERHQTIGLGQSPDLGERGPGDDPRPDLFGQYHELVDPGAATVTAPATHLAAATPPEPWRGYIRHD